MQLKQRRTGGFTLIEIMIAVAIIGMVAVLAIPNAMRAREAAQISGILNNLRIIEDAKTQWALNERKGTDAIPDPADLQVYVGLNKWPGDNRIVNELYHLEDLGTPAFATCDANLGQYPAQTQIKAY